MLLLQVPNVSAAVGHEKMVGIWGWCLGFMVLDFGAVCFGFKVPIFRVLIRLPLPTNPPPPPPPGPPLLRRRKNAGASPRH